MTFEEAAQHVGDAVIYTPRTDEPGLRGKIKAMKQLPLVEFEDGSILQCNPYCLELLDESPTLFGSIHDGD